MANLANFFGVHKGQLEYIDGQFRQYGLNRAGGVEGFIETAVNYRKKVQELAAAGSMTTPEMERQIALLHTLKEIVRDMRGQLQKEEAAKKQKQEEIASIDF